MASAMGSDCSRTRGWRGAGCCVDTAARDSGGAEGEGREAFLKRFQIVDFRLPIGRKMTRPVTLSIADLNGTDHECVAEAFDTVARATEEFAILIIHHSAPRCRTDNFTALIGGTVRIGLRADYFAVLIGDTAATLGENLSRRDA